MTLIPATRVGAQPTRSRDTFPTDYVILGNRREQVRMAGNAVTPPAARDLIATVVEALEGAA